MLTIFGQLQEFWEVETVAEKEGSAENEAVPSENLLRGRNKKFLSLLLVVDRNMIRLVPLFPR